MTTIDLDKSVAVHYGYRPDRPPQSILLDHTRPDVQHHRDGDSFDEWGEPATDPDAVLHGVAVCRPEYVARVVNRLLSFEKVVGDVVLTDPDDWAVPWPPVNPANPPHPQDTDGLAFTVTRRGSNMAAVYDAQVISEDAANLILGLLPYGDVDESYSGCALDPNDTLSSTEVNALRRLMVYLGDPAGCGNGRCDECGEPIVDCGPGQPRDCGANPDHDPYSDGHNNGGDPLPGEDT